MKSKKQYQMQKSVMSQETFKNTLARDIAQLQADCDVEITRLTRLRNEIKDIEATRKSFAMEIQSFERAKEEFRKDSEATSQAIVAVGKMNSKKLDDAQKYLDKAALTLKLADERLKTAEAREKITSDIARASQARVDTAKALEAKNEKAIKIITDQQARSRALIEESNNLKRETSAESQKCARKAFELSDLEEKLNQERKANEEQIAAAKLLNAKAQETLNEARSVAAASQLSVDRQWNEIEIQKKNIKIIELRITKLASDKGVEEELKKLEGK